MERPAAGTLLLERWRGSKRSSGQMTSSALHGALCFVHHVGCVKSSEGQVVSVREQGAVCFMIPLKPPPRPRC